MPVSNKANWSRLKLAAAPLAALLLASVLPVTLFSGTPVQAQLFFSRLPPGQIIAIVRSQGYQNPSYPYFRGDIYVVDAFDPRGVRVRLVIDPRSGDIVERLLIRNQRVIAVPDAERGYSRSTRILNPSEEAAEGQRRTPQPPRRAARRPVEQPAVERAPDIAAPVEQQPRERPAEPIAPGVAQEPSRPRNRPLSLPRETVPRETVPRETVPRETAPKEAVPRETVQGGSSSSSAPSATGPSAPSVPGDSGAGNSSASGGERGTRSNPRRVGPVILPPAVGVE